MSTPQNPYHSCIVSAAAGAGKTWQLSRRFLFLVGAHAAPHEILTITFTRKAAAEMRARVIACATELTVDAQAQREFDTALHSYYEDFSRKTQVQPPLRAEQVGNTILSQSQKLNIATIDSVCHEWLASLAGQGFADIPRPFKIITAVDATALRERSWQQLWQTLPAFAQATVREEGTTRVRNTITKLHDFGLPEARLHQLNVTAAEDWLTLRQRLAALSPAFAACKEAQNCADLRILGLLWGKKISRKSLSPAEKKQLKPQLDELEQDLQARQQADKEAHLNARGEIYFALWQQWQKIYRELKKTQRALDFQDLTMLVGDLLRRDTGLLFYLQQRIAHLLLDEFQDTSALQWDIFHQLSCELLAGENCVAARQGIQATVFVVGDPKQSIYAFRGASANIMHQAAEDLAKFKPQHHPLAVNYRSAPHLLKFFNVVFPALHLPDFLPHQPATGAQQVADYGTITLAPLATTEVEEEAQYVARHLAQTLKTKTHLKASDICILYRNATHAEIFRAALLKEGLSSLRHEERGFFRTQVSRDLLAMCKWLAMPQDQPALLTVLRSPLVGMPAETLLHVYAQQQAAGRAYHSTYILQALAEHYPQQVQVLRDVCAMCHKVTPSRLLLYALQRLNALHVYRRHGGEFVGQQAQQNIVCFIDLIATAEREGCHTLTALHVRLAAQAQHDSIGTVAAHTDAVTLMTLHKAKGLQFPYVVLVQAQEKWMKRDNYWLKSDTGITYSGTLNERPQDSELDKLYAVSDKDNAAEALRLLYVALTRGEHYLLLCGRTPKRQRKEDGFLARIVAAVQASDLPLHTTKEGENDIITIHGTTASPAQASMHIHHGKQASHEGQAVTSPTAGEHGKGLSQEIKILLPHQKSAAREEPQVHSPAARVYGIYLHKALEQQVKQAPLPERAYWDELAAELGEESEQLWHKAESTLHKLLASSVWQGLWRDAMWSKAEMPIVCLDEDLLINGVIDLLICYPQQRLQIIDYKTGGQRDDLSTYQQQLSTYRKAVSKLYPDHTITTALLFTSDAELVPVA